MRIKLEKKKQWSQHVKPVQISYWSFLGKMSTVPPANWPQISWSLWKRQNVSVVRIDESRADSLYSVPLLDQGYFRLDQRFFLCWRHPFPPVESSHWRIWLELHENDSTNCKHNHPTPSPLHHSQISRINLNNSAKFRKGFWFKCITSL